MALPLNRLNAAQAMAVALILVALVAYKIALPWTSPWIDYAPGALGVVLFVVDRARIRRPQANRGTEK